MTRNRNEYMKDWFRRNPWMRSLALARRRCNNPRHEKFPWYGGKGIKCLLTKEQIKELWIRDKADQMVKPSIDRLESTGNYEFSNCRFIELVRNREDAKLVPVKQYNLNRKLVKVWPSIKEAAEATKALPENIVSCCKGRRTHARGYFWRYV